MRILMFLSLFLSFSAFASYECSFRISNEENFDIVEQEKVVLIDEDEFTSKNIELLVLNQTEENKTSIVLDAIFVGWLGEEQVSFDILRRSEADEISEEVLSPRISLTGSGEQAVWAETHKIDFDCRVI